MLSCISSYLYFCLLHFAPVFVLRMDSQNLGLVGGQATTQSVRRDLIFNSSEFEAGRELLASQRP